MLYKLAAYRIHIFRARSLNRLGIRAVIIMTIIAAISNGAAETRRDYSNPKPIAGAAKLYTGPASRRGDNRAAQFDTRPARAHADRDVKIEDVG